MFEKLSSPQHRSKALLDSPFVTQQPQQHSFTSPVQRRLGRAASWNNDRSFGTSSQQSHNRIHSKKNSSLHDRTTKILSLGFRSWTDPVGKHKYLYVPGNFNQGEAWGTAESNGGYPVVFNTMGEWQRVMKAFDYRTIAYAHTGHYQLSDGAEPGLKWVTYTGEPSAPLNFLFNSDGPDDGVRNKWGYNLKYNVTVGADGTASYQFAGNVFYGPSQGKNEDAGVIWKDNDGRLEDVSVNSRGGVLVEINNASSSKPGLVNKPPLAFLRGL